MDSDIVTEASDVDRAEITAMGREVIEMLRLVHEAFGHLDALPIDQASRIGHLIHKRERGLVDRLVGRHGAGRSHGHFADEEVVFVAMHLERIAENVERLASATSKMVREGTLFTDRAIGEMSGLLQSMIEVLEGVRDAVRTGNGVLMRFVLDAGRSCEVHANEYALFHEKRLVEGVCQPRASSVYLGMLDDIKGIEWHARQVAQKLQRTGLPAQAPTKDNVDLQPRSKDGL
jgi:Na+/phosphate symporter